MTAPEIKEVAATITDEKQVVVETDGCPRYLGRVIKNVNTKAPTPEWMERALAAFRYSSAQYFGRYYQLCIDGTWSTFTCI